jgi:hypothetical protein
MEFPIEIERLINEFAKPLTRPDWKKGSFIYKKNTTINNHIKYIGSGYCINYQFNEMMSSLEHSYMEKLIPDGRLEFNEEHFIWAYEAYYLDKAEWED